MPNDPLQNLALLIDAAVKTHGAKVILDLLSNETQDAVWKYLQQQNCGAHC